MSEPQLPPPGPEPAPEPHPAPLREGREARRARRRGTSGLWFPIALVVVGVLALLDQFGLLWWVRWEAIWPLALIAFGAYLILRRWR